jgi:Leucine-rich repeat (LRR) protein
MEFDPKNRYQSAGALKQALKEYKNRAKKKLALAFLSVIAACVIFLAGMVVERYTGFLEASVEAVFNVDAPYVFTEPLIEEAVRLMLEIPDGQPVTRSDLENVTELYIVGNKVLRDEMELSSYIGEGIGLYGLLSSLEDLRHMKNLRQLNIHGQLVSDLSPLADCKMLRHLSFVNCPITDILPLASLTQLWNLGLGGGAQIHDFSPLNNLPSLSLLWVAKEMEPYLSTLTNENVQVNITN